MEECPAAVYSTMAIVVRHARREDREGILGDVSSGNCRARVCLTITDRFSPWKWWDKWSCHSGGDGLPEGRSPSGVRQCAYTSATCVLSHVRISFILGVRVQFVCASSLVVPGASAIGVYQGHDYL